MTITPKKYWKCKHSEILKVWKRSRFSNFKCRDIYLSERNKRKKNIFSKKLKVTGKIDTVGSKALRVAIFPLRQFLSKCFLSLK